MVSMYSMYITLCLDILECIWRRKKLLRIVMCVTTGFSLCKIGVITSLPARAGSIMQVGVTLVTWCDDLN